MHQGKLIEIHRYTDYETPSGVIDFRGIRKMVWLDYTDPHIGDIVWIDGNIATGRIIQKPRFEEKVNWKEEGF
jgi:hypothetical protein